MEATIQNVTGKQEGNDMDIFRLAIINLPEVSWDGDILYLHNYRTWVTAATCSVVCLIKVQEIHTAMM